MIGFFCWNETYASREPSGDHDGDMIGSFDVSIACALAPSASATIRRNWVPRFST